MNIKKLVGRDRSPLIPMSLLLLATLAGCGQKLGNGKPECTDNRSPITDHSAYDCESPAQRESQERFDQ